MNKTLILLGTVSTIALCGSAQAGHFNGWYLGIEGGAVWVDDIDYSSVGTLIGVTTHTHLNNAEFDTGWAVLATVGYGFAGNWRLELEGGYRSNDLDSLYTQAINTVTPFDNTYDDGSLEEVTIMANVLYDFPLGQKMSLNVGGGVGADYVKYKVDSGPTIDVDDWSIAAQAIAGLSYALGQQTDLFLNYRYLWVEEPDFAGTQQSATHFLAAFDDLQKHTVTVGLRFDLSPDYAAPIVAPPPEVPPEQPIAEPKQFIIFFAFNKCNITNEAENVLADAAATAKSTGAVSIRIVGHTDTVGSNKYNQKLSLCRANATKSNLVAKGISEGSISTAGRGESELMVQTADGVKEPQNRRATIDLQ